MFHISFVLTSKAKEFFEKFRKTFLTTFLFRDFDLNRKIKLKTNALKFVISKIISQLNETLK